VDQKKLFVTPRPLKGAAEIARSGDLSLRMEVASDDEIGQLARVVNALADRLEHKTRPSPFPLPRGERVG